MYYIVIRSRNSSVFVFVGLHHTPGAAIYPILLLLLHGARFQSLEVAETKTGDWRQKEDMAGLERLPLLALELVVSKL